jgi:putative hydrolase of the HAD superfamily
VVRGVIFDFYGTLVSEEPGEIASDVAILERYGYHELAIERLRWIDPVTRLDHAEFSASRADYLGWQRDQWLTHLREAGVAEEHLGVLVDHAETRSGQRRLEVFAEVPTALLALRAEGIRIAVCSNWGWDLAQAIDACQLTELVDVQVTSAQAGYRKPHRRIYETALESLGLAAREVVFVGDDWSSDVEGPQALGIRSFHLVRGEAGANADGVPRVADLSQLAEAVIRSAG